MILKFEIQVGSCKFTKNDVPFATQDLFASAYYICITESMNISLRQYNITSPIQTIHGFERINISYCLSLNAGCFNLYSNVLSPFCTVF